MKEKTYKGTLAFAKARRRAFWHVARPGILAIEASNTPPAPLETPLHTPFPCTKHFTNGKIEGEDIEGEHWRSPRLGNAPFGASPGPASRPLRLAIHHHPHWKTPLHTLCIPENVQRSKKIK